MSPYIITYTVFISLHFLCFTNILKSFLQFILFVIINGLINTRSHHSEFCAYIAVTQFFFQHKLKSL